MEQKNVWNEIAEKWQKFRKFPPPEVGRFLKAKRGKILDLGCGSGRNIIENARVEYYGVDFSEKMLAYAEDHTNKHEIKAQFFLAESFNLPFEDNFFDAAIFISTLHCIDKPEKRIKSLEELHRVMKGGAEAMISVWDKDTNNRLSELKAKEGYLNWQKDGKNYQRYYYFYDKEELVKILKKVGFKQIKTEIASDEKHARKNIIFYVKK